MSDAQVLIVEDEPLICELIYAALEDEDLRVACAADPDKAFEALDANEASLRLLVTDVNLRSHLTGFDVAREARRRIPEIFVIYTTGHAEADIREHGVAGGMMVPKPYSPVDLAGRIAALVKVAGQY